jgi:hypothetical protein
MNSHITYQAPVEQNAISFEKYEKLRTRRRKRVAKRILKRFPLFAAEFMRAEFPEVTSELVWQEAKPLKKRQSKRRKKTPLSIHGRYPLMKKELVQYSLTKNIKHLREAQRLRNNMYKPFVILYALGKERKEYTLPSTASVSIVKQLSALKYSSWEDLDEQWNELTKWGFR